MSISLNNVVRVSIAGPSKGLAVVNTSALAILTHETPLRPWGPDRESSLYLDAQGVAKDFGSDSVTYSLAESVFSQKATLLKGGGHLLVIPRKAEAPASPATLSSISGVNFLELKAEDYVLRVWDDGSTAKDLAIGRIDLTDMSSITASLNSKYGDEGNDLKFTVSGDITNAFVTVKTEATGVAARISLAPLPVTEAGTDLATALNLLDKDDDGEATGTDAGTESVKDTILRTVGKIPYFGVIYTEKLSDEILLETSATVQSLNILQFVASNNFDDLKEGKENEEGGVSTGS